MLQFRPKGGWNRHIRDPMYAPHRDIAYIGPQLLFMATMEALEPKTWEPWYKALMEHYNISAEALSDAAMRLSAAFGDVSSLRWSWDEALKRSGFTAMPPAVQGLFYMKLGRYLLAAMHRGLGDITDYDGDPPPQAQDMVEDIQKLAQKLRCG